MTAALEGGEWSAARLGRTLPPGKTRYPLYRRLGGLQDWSGWAENFAPTGIRSRTVQPVVSHYTDWATRPTHTHTHTRTHRHTHTHRYIYIYIYIYIHTYIHTYTHTSAALKRVLNELRNLNVCWSWPALLKGVIRLRSWRIFFMKQWLASFLEKIANGRNKLALS